MGEKAQRMGTVRKIYLLHGWSDSTQKWGTLVRLLERRGFVVHLPLIPGLTEELKEVWGLENYVVWLEKLLEKEDKVILAGHSNGGRISLAFALKHPEKIHHLVLIDSAGVYHNHFTRRLKRFLFKSLARTGKKLTKSEKLRSLLYKMAREKDYEKADPILRQTLTNLIKVDLVPQLPSLKVPTLIIWGENDKATPLKDGLLIHQQIKGSVFKMITGARHSPQFTHPELVADYIEEGVK